MSQRLSGARLKVSRRSRYPREIDFIAALPKTPSGKIQRFVLRGVNRPER